MPPSFPRNSWLGGMGGYWGPWRIWGVERGSPGVEMAVSETMHGLWGVGKVLGVLLRLALGRWEPSCP